MIPTREKVKSTGNIEADTSCIARIWFYPIEGIRRVRVYTFGTVTCRSSDTWVRNRHVLACSGGTWSKVKTRSMISLR